MENYLDFCFLSQKAHENAVNNGFWDEQHTNENCLMLIITEISEAVEADRKCRRANVEMYDLACSAFGDSAKAFEIHIKDTVEDEFADVMIRLADQAGALYIEFDKLLTPRYFRQFSRFGFTENAFALVKGISRQDININKRLQWALMYVKTWAESMHIDLAWHIAKKMEYNAGRAMRHGKAY